MTAEWRGPLAPHALQLHALRATLPQRWSGLQSALHPVGPQAGRISTLWWAMLVVSTLVYIIVIAFLLYAVFRRRRRAPQPDTEGGPPHAQHHGQGGRRTVTTAVAVATGVTAAILFAFLCYDFLVGRSITLPAVAGRALHVDVIGHQWWWEVQYDDPVPQHRLTTANEIHVPVGRPVVLTLTSGDVIHSFWVPNVNGKTDLIPGYQVTTWFQVDTPGVYRGQCAEFCGLQHGKMALFIVAEPQDAYAAWYAKELQPASPPGDPLRAKGERVFLAGPCSSCHAVRGTMAGGTAGPELTHLAGRMTLAAGTLPNTSEHLARWILGPQLIKPGNNMPQVPLSGPDLQALVAYLGGLQ